jgi:hypothetical protein
MAYDIHIVRTNNWLDAADDPITKEQVDSLIAADPELEWSTTDWVDMRAKRGTKVTRYFMILWKSEPCFWWYLDQITCSGPSEEQVGKLMEMAAALSANVFGDDGEAYLPDTWRAVYRGELK